MQTRACFIRSSHSFVSCFSLILFPLPFCFLPFWLTVPSLALSFFFLLSCLFLFLVPCTSFYVFLYFVYCVLSCAFPVFHLCCFLPHVHLLPLLPDPFASLPSPVDPSYHVSLSPVCLFFFRSWLFALISYFCFLCSSVSSWTRTGSRQCQCFSSSEDVHDWWMTRSL